MFDFQDEAIDALASKSVRPVTESDDSQSWQLQQLIASRSGDVIHVKFKTTDLCVDERARELRKDFSRLADCLVNNSQVLLDFEGLHEFCPASIAALAMFDLRLKSKGSRLALCNLEATVQASFFPNRASC
jgi:hypothetical protein